MLWNRPASPNPYKGGRWAGDNMHEILALLVLAFVLCLGWMIGCLTEKKQQQ